MEQEILGGRAAAYRAQSEALHRAPLADRRAARLAALWDCGLFDLVRADFYGLLAAPAAPGALLEAGCGSGIEAANLGRLLPGVEIHAVDVSGVALARAVARAEAAAARFRQAALEALPFAAASFDYVLAHEVIEHVEDPRIVLAEFARVLGPGGVCLVATPNGASLWLEHLRQRLKRARGRRGAAVGLDHTRPPSFWRREFARAGLVVERQIFDAAAVEFLMFVAPPRSIPWLARLFEPLRALPGVNLLLCDRVKFRLVKPGSHGALSAAVRLVCPLCRADLAENEGGANCAAGHRFARNSSGLVDFTALAPALQEPSAAAAEPPAPPPVRRDWRRRARRLALWTLSLPYAGFLLLLTPLALVVRLFYRPLGSPPGR
jgi:SAM-dependent methyltransferase